MNSDLTEFIVEPVGLQFTRDDRICLLSLGSILWVCSSPEMIEFAFCLFITRPVGYGAGLCNQQVMGLNPSCCGVECNPHRHHHHHQRYHIYTRASVTKQYN